MTLRTALFASAAFAAVTIGAGMAFAQTDYRAEPTPQEQQQTQTLNQKADDNAAPMDASAKAADNADQQKYQQQLDQYRARERKYWESQADFEKQRDSYALQSSNYDISTDQLLANRAWYDEHHYRVYTAYPDYPEERLQPLYLIAEPTQQISQAPVIDFAGYEIGHVRNVETAVDGRPARVQIALTNHRFVWVMPGELRFDPQGHAVYSDLSAQRLWDLSVEENS
ncbi:MAG TPA: hypothetical protein VIJ62_14505 [Rhizomicrobium sp.]